MDRALPIDEPQVLFAYDDDTQYPYHHRVLLRRCGEGVWVVATPDLDVQVEDVREHNLVALGRGASVPSAVQGRCYMFSDLSESQLDDLHAQATRLADLLGVGAGAAAGSSAAAGGWRVADSAAEDFGVEVPADLVMNPATGVQRDAVRLALFGDPARWVAVERVNAGDLADWRTEKRLGGGRDPRLGGLASESAMGGLVSLEPGSRCSAASAVSGCRSSRQAGIHREAAVAWEHRMLYTSLGMATC